MPSRITSNTQIVDKMEAFIPVAILPIKILATIIRKGNLPITRNKTICQYGNQTFTRRVNNSTSNNTCCITTKTHAHGCDKMVVLESIDKCGVVRFVNVRIGMYFRLWNYPYAISTSNLKRRIWLWKRRKMCWRDGLNLERKN